MGHVTHVLCSDLYFILQAGAFAYPHVQTDTCHKVGIELLLSKYMAREVGEGMVEQKPQ